MNTSRSGSAINYILLMGLLAMAINWKNLNQIKCNEGHCQHQSTVLDHQNKLELYIPSALHVIRQCFNHDRKLQILQPTTCKNIRHLRIHRRKTRGKRAGKSSPPPDKPSEVIRDTLTPIQLNKDAKFNRNKYISLVLSNIQSLHNKDTLLLDHLVEEKADLCIVTETWL